MISYFINHIFKSEQDHIIISNKDTYSSFLIYIHIFIYLKEGKDTSDCQKKKKRKKKILVLTSIVRVMYCHLAGL